jgi:hypothetical protein
MEILNSLYMNKAQENLGKQFYAPVAAINNSNRERFQTMISPMKRDVL